MPQAQKSAPIDVFVGERLQEFRKKFRMSQSQLGDILGVSYQQIQKYEKGDNRLGANAIVKLTQAFEIPASFFFAGFKPTNATSEPVIPRDEEIIQMLSLFLKIKDPEFRQQLLSQAAEFAKS